MRNEILEILKRHEIHDWEINEHVWPEEPWKVRLKTLENNEKAIEEIENFLNRKARAFGMQGPFLVVWEKLTTMEKALISAD